MGYLTRKLTKEALRELDKQDDPEKRRRLEEQLWNADCFILYDETDRPKQQPIEEETSADDADEDNKETDTTEKTGAKEHGELQQEEAGKRPAWTELIRRHGRPAPGTGSGPARPGRPAN